jgi:hypothetical protein
MPAKYFGIPAYDGPLTRRVRKLIGGNPKRGASKIRFAHYRTGMTVAEHIQKCEASGVPNRAVFDLTWDSDPKRRFVEFYD